MEAIDISVLPKEIKNNIASFLDGRSKRMIRTTSTEWFNIINYDDFTIYFASPSTLPDIVHLFSRYSKPIGLQFEKTISINNRYTMLASLTNLTRLEVEPSRFPGRVGRFAPQILEHFTALTALKTIQFADYIIEPYILSSFLHLTHVTILGFYEYSLMEEGQGLLRINAFAELGNITCLKSIEISDNHGTLVFDEESVAKLSNVSKVSITGLSHVPFPFSKLPNMESLTVSNIEFDDFSMNTKLTYLSVSFASNPFIARNTSRSMHDYNQLSALEHLKDLKLSLDISDAQYSFLSRLTCLEDLTVRPVGCLLTGQFLQFISSSKLTSLVVTIPSSLEPISHLTNLRHLNYYVELEGTKEIPFKLTNVTSLIAHDVMMAKCCPNLKSLQVNTPIIRIAEDRDLLASLWQLESLEMFALMDNVAFQVICELTRLTRLKAKFDSAAPPCAFNLLTKLTALKDLNFNVQTPGTTLKFDGLLPALRTLTNLEQLQLFYVGFNDELIQTLESLPKLKHLAIRANSEEFNELRLSKLTNLQTLQRLPKESAGIPIPWPDCKLIGLLPYLYDCWSSYEPTRA